MAEEAGLKASASARLLPPVESFLAQLMGVNKELVLMQACSSQLFVLEHYLRLATREPSHWLASLQLLTGSPRLSQEIRGTDNQKDFFGRLACLQAQRTNLCGIYLNSPLKIFGSNAESLAIIMPLQGTVEFGVDDRTFLCAPGVPFVLEPNVEFCASVSEAAQFFIVQLNGFDFTKLNTLPESGDLQLAALLKNYLVETAFFRNHGCAMEQTQRFEHTLARYCENEVPFIAKGRSKELFSNEPRICQALHLINERLEQDVELESIARDSGLSLRNFYYLMKKYTGMAPYRYCRSRRLIKARESLIYHYKSEPLIANHARKWGFHHQGRFSSYYFEHFGEYPSETLECLKSLTEKSQKVVAFGDRSGLQRTLYTSAISHHGEECGAGV